MNKRMLNIALTLVIAIGLCLSSGYVQAGLIDHKVTIKNDTDGTAYVTLETWNGDRKEMKVGPKSEDKFHTGTQCPKILYGLVDNPYDGKKNILTHCIKSGENDPICKGLNCKSSTHRLEPFRVYPDKIGGYKFIKE